MTFRMSQPGSPIPSGHTISFDIVNYGSDSGELYKYVSIDGMNWTQVGDLSCATGTHTFGLLPAPEYVFFRLRVGTNSIYDGVHVDNFLTTLFFAGSGAQTDCPCFGYECEEYFKSADELPLSMELGAAVPNPFNPTTSIELTLMETKQVRLAVYNLKGEEVRVLVDGMLARGSTQLRFDGSGLPSGVYLYELRTEDYRCSRKMLLLK